MAIEPTRRSWSPGEQTPRADRFWAGSVRIVMAVITIVTLPLFFSGARHYLGVLFAYLIGAILFQLAIARDVGGVYRQLIGGAMDVALVTFVAHRMGSISTPFLAAYPLVGMFYALVAPTWAAITLASLGIVAYAAVCYSEALGLLPFAPDFPHLAAFAPSVASATPRVVMLAAFVSVSTLISRRIALALQRRERELREHETELREVNAQLEELSQRDPLTQLYNRRHFVHRVGEELARVRRGHSMVLLMMDLDGFKKVNDTEGHLAGDVLLRGIAGAIEGSTREVDVVARFGGDEFVAMLTDTDADRAVAVAERMLAAIRVAGAKTATSRPVTASIGLAAARADHDVNALLATADAAAYRAKREGGNRCCIGSDDPGPEAVAQSTRRPSTGEHA